MVELNELQIIAGRKDDMLKKYPENEKEIKHFIENDPTQNRSGKYLEWQMKVLAEKDYPIEDIVSVVKDFEKYKDKLQKKDINQWDTKAFMELRDTLATEKLKVIEKKDVSKDEDLIKIERDYAESGSEIIYTSPKFIIRLMKNKIASCHYGAGYPWCISNKNQTMWENYEAQNKIFFVVLPQFEVENKQNDRIVICIARDTGNRAREILFFNRINKGSGDPEAKAFMEKMANKGEFAKIEAKVIAVAEAQPKGILAKLYDNSVAEKDILHYYNNVFKKQAPLPQNATEDDRQVRRQNDSYIETEIVRSKKTPTIIKKELAMDGNVEAILAMRSKKVANVYNDKEMEEQFKQVPFEVGNDIGVSHTFSNNSGDFIHEKNPGMFRFMNPKAISPENASPASYLSTPREAEKKEAAAPLEHAQIEKNLNDRGLNTGRIDPKFDEKGFDKQHAPGKVVIEGETFNFVVIKGYGGKLEIKSDDIKRSKENGVFKKFEPNLELYIYNVLTDLGGEVMGKGTIVETKEKMKGKKPGEMTNDERLKNIFDKIEGFRYKTKDVKGTLYSYATIPVEEFKKAVEENKMNFEELKKKKSGNAGDNGEYMWKFLEGNRLMIIK